MTEDELRRVARTYYMRHWLEGRWYGTAEDVQWLYELGLNKEERSRVFKMRDRLRQRRQDESV